MRYVRIVYSNQPTVCMADPFVDPKCAVLSVVEDLESKCKAISENIESRHGKNGRDLAEICGMILALNKDAQILYAAVTDLAGKMKDDLVFWGEVLQRVDQVWQKARHLDVCNKALIEDAVANLSRDCRNVAVEAETVKMGRPMCQKSVSAVLKKLHEVYGEAHNLYAVCSKYEVNSRGDQRAFWKKMKQKVGCSWREVCDWQDTITGAWMKQEEEAIAAEIEQCYIKVHALRGTNNHLSELFTEGMDANLSFAEKMTKLQDDINALYKECVVNSNRLNALRRICSQAEEVKIQELLQVLRNIRKNCVFMTQKMKSQQVLAYKTDIQALLACQSRAELLNKLKALEKRMME